MCKRVRVREKESVRDRVCVYMSMFKKKSITSLKLFLVHTYNHYIFKLYEDLMSLICNHSYQLDSKRTLLSVYRWGWS